MEALAEVGRALLSAVVWFITPEEILSGMGTQASPSRSCIVADNHRPANVGPPVAKWPGKLPGEAHAQETKLSVNWLARDVLKYIVSCALPAGRKVSFVADGVSYTYPGELGLAPQWEKADGNCNDACQQWVSACVMARVDFLGVKVLISVRGDAPPLKAPLVEQATYTVREGAYFGNIFAATTERYACIAPGRTGLLRVCGPTMDGCAVEAVGECDQICKKPGSDGSFPKCSNANSLAAQGQSSFQEKIYDGTVTVFLAP